MRTMLALSAFLLTMVLLCPQANAAKPSILIINSYHAGYPWVMSHNEALREELGDYATLTFYYMDTKRLHASKHQRQADLGLLLYEAIRPDLVILADDNALKMLGNVISVSGTPTVYLGINDNPRNYFTDTPLATGVLERPLLKRSLVFLKEIMQGTLTKCLVLFDNGTTSQATFDYVFKGNSRLVFAGITTDIRLINTYAEWRTIVQDAGRQGYDAIIIGLYHTLTDDIGDHVNAEDVARWTAVNTVIPIFGFWDFSISKDMAVGGLVLAGAPQGRQAAIIAKRLLDGESPLDVQPIAAEQGRFKFSRSGLETWGITLPPKFIESCESIEYVD